MLTLPAVPTSRAARRPGRARLATAWLRALLVASLTGVVGAACAAPDSGVRPGMSFSAARGLLLQKKYRPVASGSRDASRCSAGRQDVCEAYPETISCSGTGTAPCRFIFASPTAGALTIVADGRNAGELRVRAIRHSAAKDAEWQGRGP